MFKFKKLSKLTAILLSLDWVWYRALLLFRVAPSIEHVAILKYLQPDFIVDVGANRGQFTLAALNVLPQANVLCFEPLESAYNGLSRLFNFETRVSMHNTAIGDVDTHMSMNVSNKEDSSSLLEISDLQAEIFPGTEHSEVEKVSVCRLSKFMTNDLLDKNILIKIDVQGYELEVLRGAGEILSKVQTIYVECSFVELYAQQADAKDVIEFLSTHGFSLDGVYNLEYDALGMAVQGDFLFTNSMLQ